MAETEAETHLDNFLIRHTSQENVLLILIGMDSHYIWNLAIVESL
jgi:hypothetical protein